MKLRYKNSPPTLAMLKREAYLGEIISVFQLQCTGVTVSDSTGQLAPPCWVLPP